MNWKVRHPVAILCKEDTVLYVEFTSQIEKEEEENFANPFLLNCSVLTQKLESSIFLSLLLLCLIQGLHGPNSVISSSLFYRAGETFNKNSFPVHASIPLPSKSPSCLVTAPQNATYE